MIPVEAILILSSLIFSIGIYGALTRRNMFGILMSLELILNSSCLNFAALARIYSPQALTGEVAVLFIIAIAAAEVTVGLALLLSIYRNYKGITSDKINLMKG